MSGLLDFLSEDSIRTTLESKWDSPNPSYIPGLIYVSLTQGDEIKSIAGSLILKIISETSMPISSPIMSIDGESSISLKGRRQYLKPPKKCTITSKSLTYAFHLFFMVSHQFSKEILNDSLSIIFEIVKKAGNTLSTRIMVDILSFIPIFFGQDNHEISISILNEISTIGEQKSDFEVLIMAESLRTLFIV